MEIARKKFVLNTSDFWFQHKDMWLCRDILRKFFVIPRKVRTLWISLHDQPSVMRHKVKITAGFISTCIELVNVDDATEEAHRYADGVTGRILKRLVDKPIYVQVEYEYEYE